MLRIACDIHAKLTKTSKCCTGTTGLGRATVIALAQHGPAHIYFTGRNTEAAETLIAEVKRDRPAVETTFIKMNMTSLASVKMACAAFSHDRLDVLM